MRWAAREEGGRAATGKAVSHSCARCRRAALCCWPAARRVDDELNGREATGLGNERRGGGRSVSVSERTSPEATRLTYRGPSASVAGEELCSPVAATASGETDRVTPCEKKDSAWANVAQPNMNT